MVQQVQDAMINLIHIAGEEMPADIMTKALASDRHEKLTAHIMQGKPATSAATSLAATVFLPSIATPCNVTGITNSQNIVFPLVSKSILKPVYLTTSYVRPTYIVTPEILSTRKRRKPFPREHMFHTKEFHYDDPPIYINQYLA